MPPTPSEVGSPADWLRWPEGLDQAADLTEYASETRYPGSVELVSEEDYRQAVAIAEQVLTWSASIIEEAA